MEEEVRKEQLFDSKTGACTVCFINRRLLFCRWFDTVMHRRIHSSGKGAERWKATAAYTMFSVDNGENAFRGNEPLGRGGRSGEAMVGRKGERWSRRLESD